MKTRSNSSTRGSCRFLGPVAVLAAIGMAGCGNLTAGGFTGEATVIVSGDVPSPAAGPAASTLGEIFARPSASSHEDEPEGQVEVEFLAFLVTEGGGLLQLGEEEIRVRVDLRGRNETDVVSQIIPATQYIELRIVFTDIDVEVSGLVIDGMPVPEVRVELEDLSLLVARPITLDVGAGSRVELVVDLNTLSWLQAVDPQTGVVDETVFQELVDVVVR